MSDEEISWAEVVAASTEDFLAIEAKRHALAEQEWAADAAQRHGDGLDGVGEGHGRLQPS